MTKIIIAKTRRAYVLKRTIERHQDLDPTFVTDLAMNSEPVREAIYERIKDRSLRARLIASVNARVAEIDSVDVTRNV